MVTILWETQGRMQSHLECVHLMWCLKLQVHGPFQYCGLVSLQSGNYHISEQIV